MTEVGDIVMRFVHLCAPALIVASLLAPTRGEEPVEFNRDVRAILADSCYACHGPDSSAREDSGLRLDMAEDDAGDNGGYDVIEPGDVEGSELIHRLTTDDPDERMPPADSGRPAVTPGQLEVIRRWIEQGAEYEGHWAFITPTRQELPEVTETQWTRNKIDHFVLTRLEAEGLRPSPEANRERLIRRVTLDLTGLPPTLEEIDAYLADDQPEAYERVVDRLLASPRYGERMALPWLDLSRYSDSHGYQYDQERQMWAWREWVIAAYNENKPFDEFTIEQLAGDLLPDATIEQKLATAFNRHHPITVEGGVIDEEYRTEYVIDRVSTMSTAWLGLTMGCARCHDHKYDPVSQQEFYQLFAFFNHVSEKGYRGFDPKISLTPPLRQRQIDAFDGQLEVLEEHLQAVISGNDANISDEKRMQERILSLRQERDALAALPRTSAMVLNDDQQRSTHLLIRGEYDNFGEEVQAEVPAALSLLPEDAPRDRLGLAQWLVDPSHPLTARVTVNRYWMMYFGTGLVKTSGDFGSQGEWPSHPELLDELAREFIDGGWDVKAMQRLIVTSATYRQSSRVTQEMHTRDPENRLLARGPQLRLEAEFVRDNVLFISGLLVEQLGGPSVYPYHPTGLWMEMNNRPGASRAYPQGSGDDLYRRSMYWYWKRTMPPPSLSTFDAPEREFCVDRRGRTNTPLQALVLLHDPQYVEAARYLAERMMTEGGATLEEQLAYGFRLATSRRPTDQEQAVLLRVHEEERSALAGDPETALVRLAVGDSPRNEDLDPVEHASLFAAARVILNLHETVTKE